MAAQLPLTSTKNSTAAIHVSETNKQENLPPATTRNLYTLMWWYGVTIHLYGGEGTVLSWEV